MKAVVLLSGGLDSATTLAVAIKRDGCECHCLAFDYGQRHLIELQSAARVAYELGADHFRTVDFRALGALGGSALTGSIAVPKAGADDDGIPDTYVPARNLNMLSYAVAYAEVMDIGAIYMGVNAVDYSGYPDCRPEFIAAFARVARFGTKRGVEFDPIDVRTPLIHMSKAWIIQLGTNLGVPFGETVSCYDPDAKGRACGSCDSCSIRRKGFVSAGVLDPTRYQEVTA